MKYDGHSCPSISAHEFTLALANPILVHADQRHRKDHSLAFDLRRAFGIPNPLLRHLMLARTPQVLLRALIDGQECPSYFHRNTTSTPIALSFAKPGIQCGFRTAMMR